MGLIKDIYCQSFYERLADVLNDILPSFEKERFISRMLGDDFETMEWKGRMTRTTKVFHEFVPENFAEAVLVIQQTIKKLREENFGEDGLAFVFFPDYIAAYGLDDFEASVKALEFVTQFVSCEFAVRPFILKYGDRMISQMIIWSEHENYKVRRLASEGSRPRLPWAMAIPALKKDPSPILPLLENLKHDPSEWVRRSVANNINDIAKDHPDVVIALASRWKGLSKETDAIVKHGCRTLLKQGHSEILKQYGLESEYIAVGDLQILTPEVKIGDSLAFSFSVTNLNAEAHTIRLEYGVYYMKGNGTLARKVFKISERIYPPQAKATIQRRQSFRLITTRRFYTGQHQLSVIVNGKEHNELKSFEVIA